MDFNNRVLERSRSNRMLGGICGGMGKYLNMDPTIIRVLYVLLTLFTVFCGIIAYIVLLFVIPEERG
ncbi:MAG: PspC domain-containing protein [Bacteroidaceae bacterium]|nr:PspC domain-containing protein [Bacteroidaceae bacterium]